MYKTLLTIVLICLALLSCSKNNDPEPEEIPGFYVKFNANGKEYLFDKFGKDEGSASAVFSRYNNLTDSLYSSSILIFKNFYTPYPGITISLRSKTKIKPSVFKYEKDNPNSYVTIDGDRRQKVIIHMSLPKGELNEYEFYSTDEESIITITKLDSVSMKGTFSGKLKAKIGETMLIDQGKFNLPTTNFRYAW